jgi:hypothetical protein
MLKIKIAGSKGQVKVRNVPSGSFSVRTADRLNSPARAWGYCCSWHAVVACSDIYVCYCNKSYAMPTAETSKDSCGAH